MIRFDESGFPVIVVHFDKSATDEEFVRYLDQMSAVLRRGQRYALVLNATRAHVTPMRQLRMQADWLRAHRLEVAELNVGTAFVFSSSVFRIVMTGVFMLQPPLGPHHVCGTLGEGVRWAAAQIGVEPSAAHLSWDPDETTRPN